METESDRVEPREGPPYLLDAAVRGLLPPRFRYAATDLGARYVSPGRYLREAAVLVPHLAAASVVRAFVPHPAPAVGSSFHREFRTVPKPAPVPMAVVRGLNLLWMVSGAALLLQGVHEGPAALPAWDFLMGVMWGVAFVAGYRPRVAVVFGEGPRSLVALFHSPQTSGSTRRPPRRLVDGLAGRGPRAFVRESWNRAARSILFFVLLSPLVACFWTVEIGRVDAVGLGPVSLYAGLFAVLTVFGRVVARLNLRVAHALDAGWVGAGAGTASGP